MRYYLESFLIKIGVNVSSRNNILATYDALISNKINEHNLFNIISLYKDENVQFNLLLNKFREFAKNILKDSLYETDLVFVCLLTKKLHEIYKEKNLSDKLFYSTLKDIKYKIYECEHVEHTTGTFVVEWYSNFFNLKLFAFGRLEYEIAKFEFEYNDLHKDSLAISIHIPNDGTRLDEDSVNESLKEAKEFFKSMFKDGKVLFKCSSWLLYFKNREFLSKDSNIVKFMNRFNIIFTNTFNSYDELWRIFNKRANLITSDDAKTSLTKGYYMLMKNNEKIGSCVGYFYL